ncbi:glyoxalase/bleomycin resistance/extradiol dioxygenase family protein [Methylobacterium sp. NEAU 140]|uniref:VOC family protein n=1 Tax=Methylobacterium sp. NEAU 140 TaxID=3064945 RepID=UPI0027325D8C|nr:glyoxalase/bleomycin resistance/extradiol dioxygenase family protein [Methylobacterium sp. NEAU 140]MDP4025062.1 glyoxalase/bleomycin resistance/extradiol dioxygenase family protein [Methylobacterium sp. NEAU 140]
MSQAAPSQAAPNPATPSSAPAVRGGLVAYLCLDGALKAADFYGRAFGAETAASHAPDAQGRTTHVHLHVNGSSLMLSDPFPEHGCPHQPAQGFNLTLMVDDIGAWWERAIAAGATPLMPPAEMFWGDTYAQLRDPFGVTWAMNQARR